MTSDALLPSLIAGDRAPAPRTLVDIFAETVRAHPDALAIDSGVDQMSYAELAEAAEELAGRLAELGVGPGSYVGVRIKSGTTDLYVAILGILHAGAAYVPVDADDPDERARVVFGEARVAAVVGNDLVIAERRDGGFETYPGEPARAAQAAQAPEPVLPTPADDAWVIFTSGSTGTPKGVAVTHRNAAAFVDAERRMFLVSDPIGPGDRVMAGLSVGFDASCEEMWLAWAYGGALVPAPRSLVRSGVDVGGWLVANDITVVSTVPTLVALWPTEALDRVRLLIMGGEACPAEIGARLAAPGREVWNTYGPTEATVVACGTQVDGSDPVRIGLPLDGWDLAVVDEAGLPVRAGQTGELIIGGVGLARYLDPEKDAATYAPMPTLGWERAYRSGDRVVNDPEGLVFAGRADDQIKLGGRRIELGEIDGQLLRIPGVVSAAAAVRKTKSGNQLLVGYLTVDDRYDPTAALELLRVRMPAALVPRLAVVDDLPTRTSGKVDRDALPWPLAQSAARGETPELDGTHALIAEIWNDVLGADVTSVSDDFFDFGGGSLTAAQVIGRLRETFPEAAVGDLYAHPTVAGLAEALEQLGEGPARIDRQVAPIPRRTQVGQMVGLVGLRTLAAARWLAWLLLIGSVLAWWSPGWWPSAAADSGWPSLPTAPWWLLVPTTWFLIVPPGRMTVAALLARLVLRGVGPGSYPRGGKVHLRLWLAERIQDEVAATGLAGAPWFPMYARLLGNRVGDGVDLHSLPPVTGMLTLGRHAAVEPEVDLSGHWIDGDTVHVGEIRVGNRARIGARSMLAPGASVGKDAEVAPGSLVWGHVERASFASGAPVERAGDARGPWEDAPPPRGAGWVAAYGLLGLLIASLPGGAVLVGLLAGHRLAGPDAGLGELLAWLAPATLIGYAALALAVLALVRLLGWGMRTGHHPVRSGQGLRIWGTMRILDEARTWLFPLYSGALTPWWLRLLGARIGRGVEASTVLLIPKFTQVNDHAFLADDTLIGGYELGGGWVRVENVKIGKRAFVGNSGMTAPGRRVRKDSLVAVLSAAPGGKAATAGSSWMGSPPTKLRRAAAEADTSRTYAPSTQLQVRRGLVETGRLVPMILHVALYALAISLLLALAARSPVLAFATGGLVLLGVGVLAAALTTAAKWLIVGRHRVSEHPLWSAFVWRNELADTFTEVIAAPWFAAPTQGTVLLNMWLRTQGARIGRGVWCDTYWLPETDLVHLADGATVNRGCVVQTHLFHDRVLAMGEVRLAAGATLGPHSVILPAASIGRHATVGPVSLVMRGESVPSRTRWVGNPIGPWDPDAYETPERPDRPDPTHAQSAQRSSR